MQLPIPEARALIEAAMRAVGHTDDEAAIIADHLVDCELRGLGYAGLSRALAMVEYIRAHGVTRQPVKILHETPVSARIDGGNTLGYLIARQATDMAIAKAQASGMAAVGASKTYFTGMLSYYLERVTSAGLVGMIAASASIQVAPFGGTEPRFSTNPIAFGFPTDGDPVIWDIGTSSITHAEIVLAARLGRPLPAGVAYDAQGEPTRNAAEVLQDGVITTWGGHRGSGLALSIQLLAMMAGQVNDYERKTTPFDCGVFIFVCDPGLFGDSESYKHEVSKYCNDLRQSRPLDPEKPVRIPFERSASDRARRLKEGIIEAPDKVVDAIRAIAAGT